MAEEVLAFIAAVVIIIVVAKTAGYVSVRLGQPSVLGELLAGILLGPTVLDMLHSWPIFADEPFAGEALVLLAEIGVLLLMFLAGLELELAELIGSGRVAALAGTLGVIVPLLTGVALSLAFGSALEEAIFIGLALSATSVSISAQTLMELGVLRSKVGIGLLGAAVFDDILVILLLSAGTVIVGTSGGEGGGSLILIVVRMVAYILAAAALGLLVLPRLTRIVSELPISQGLIAFAIVIALTFAWASEVFGGMAAITGAFLAGLFLARTPAKSQIEQGISALAFGFFVPIFFVNIGLESNLRAITGEGWIYALILTAVAIVTKLVGSGVGAYLGGYNRLDSLRLGAGMISRGEVGLIVATVGLVEGVISQDILTIVVFMVIVATLVTPPLLRALYPSDKTPAEASRAAGGETQA